MRTRTPLFIAGAVIVVAILALGGVLVMHNHRTKNASSVTATGVADDGMHAVKSSEVQTPTNNAELSKTLDDDAASIDTTVQNLDNGEYNDSNLTDTSLYN